MATSALGLIKRSMRILGALGQGKTPSAEEAEHGLTALNTMLESLSTDRLLIYQVTEDTKVLTVGDGIYTIGSGGDLNTTRPDRLDDSCFVSDGNTDYKLASVDDRDYFGIADKSIQGLPRIIHYTLDIPLGTIRLWPVPAEAYTLHVKSWKLLQSFSTLTTEIALPRGYEEMIVFNLAERLAPEYQLAITPDVARFAAAGRRRLESLNAPRDRLVSDLASLVRRGEGDIVSGGYL